MLQKFFRMPTEKVHRKFANELTENRIDIPALRLKLKQKADLANS